MKRIITYISILAAVLSAGVSCTREAIDGNQDGGELVLRFRTEEMSTRVTVSDVAPVDGVGAENAIEHVDYFFFADANPASQAIVSGRLSGDELTKVEGSETEYKYGFNTELAQFKALKGQTYLYVLVNYPDEIQVNTMNGLLELPISTDFTEAQTSFVMDSYDNGDESGLLKLTPKSHEEQRTVEVKLARAAAKLVLNVNVKNTFEDASGNVWKPVTSQMWVNFVNARNHTTVDAEAVAFDDKAYYFNTVQKAPTAITAVDGDHTSFVADAVYTYPQTYNTTDVTAPYFKIFCPWICDKKGLNNFFYKIILPDLGSFQRNKIYKMTVDLSVIGSTEDDWALATNYIYVSDWWTPSEIETSFEGAMYLDVPVKEYEIYGVNEVYIPVLSSNNIQVTGITGSKTNLYTGDSESVSGTTTDVSKEGFKFVHALNTDMTSSDYDCTPITFTMTVKHTEGGLSKTIQVKVVQYPSIYAVEDPSNGYAYVNSYTYGNTSQYNQSGTYRGGRYRSYQNGSRVGYMAYNNNGDELASINQGDGLNSNYSQYVVTVSVLPPGYKVAGMEEDVVIGDPRGGQLANNYLGYATGTNGQRINTVQENYKPASSTTQNVIAPAIRIASSWGATTYLNNFDRAEERCAAYQENGYPAGRWRLPTVAEIDFLIRLSTYEHIPALFTTDKQDIYQSNRDASSITYSFTYYSSYWSNGPSVYAGKPYTDDGHSSAYEMGGTEITMTAPESQQTYWSGWNRYTNYGYYWWVPYDNDFGYAYIGHTLPLVTANSGYFEPHVRCVYDEWYWSSTKYNNSGQPITGTGTPAQQWIGYIF
ncbi:MAG: hypothetical protein IKG84_03305 [Bacteroidales bacterium]|nr:hypothetical protein [Fibrobacter sp.]MBR3387246.1 hypothetical protein [Bacteroidales bacterium]